MVNQDPLDDVVDIAKKIARIETERDAAVALLEHELDRELARVMEDYRSRQEAVREAAERQVEALRADLRILWVTERPASTGPVELPAADPDIPGDALNTAIVQALRRVFDMDLESLTLRVTGSQAAEARRKVSARLSFLKNNAQLVETTTRGRWRAIPDPRDMRSPSARPLIKEDDDLTTP